MPSNNIRLVILLLSKIAKFSPKHPFDVPHTHTTLRQRSSACLAGWLLLRCSALRFLPPRRKSFPIFRSFHFSLSILILLPLSFSFSLLLLRRQETVGLSLALSLSFCIFLRVALNKERGKMLRHSLSSFHPWWGGGEASSPCLLFACQSFCPNWKEVPIGEKGAADQEWMKQLIRSLGNEWQRSKI